MSVEQQVREAFAARAGQPDADPSVLEHITAAGTRRRRRRAVAAAGSALVVLVAVVVLAAGVVLDDPGDIVDVQPPATEVDPSPSTRPGPSTTVDSPDEGEDGAAVDPDPGDGGTAPPARPEVAFAIRDDPTTTRLVSISTADGAETTLFERPRQADDDTLGNVSTGPDGSVWFGSASYSCRPGGQVLRLPAGGRPQVVVDGYEPAVSPDGRWLAYAERAGPDPDVQCATTLVVRDLATGAERRWAQQVEAPDGGLALADSITRIAWHPRDPLVAVELSFEGTGVTLVDVSGPGGALAGTQVRTEPRSSYSRPAWVDASRLAVWEVCCYADAMTVDDTTRRVTFVDTAGRAVGGFDPAVALLDLDYDAGGRHLLYVTTAGELFAGWADAAPRKLADGVMQAVW